MKFLILKKVGAVGLAAVFCFSCSAIDSAKNQSFETSKTGNAAGDKTADGKTSETVSSTSSPCANRFYPVANGLKRNYDNTVGSDTLMTMEYKDGDASFTEVTTLKDITVKHNWLCTSEGLTAASYGSAASLQSMQIDPKHVSGVTLPREDEIKIGKTWTTVYKGTGKSDQFGAIDMTVTINNKIVALDDAVKTAAGDFKAVKVEMDIASDMKFGGNKMPVPVVKAASWFAPDVGMVKSTGSIGGVTNTMEYTGND